MENAITYYNKWVVHYNKRNLVRCATFTFYINSEIEELPLSRKQENMIILSWIIILLPIYGGFSWEMITFAKVPMFTYSLPKNN